MHSSRSVFKVLALTSVFCFGISPSRAFADYVVNQVKLDKNFAVLKTTASETPANGTLIQLEKGGQTCSLKVYSVKGPWVAATAESCDNFSEIQPGDQFSEGSISATPNEESPAENLPEPPADAPVEGGSDAESTQEPIPANGPQYGSDKDEEKEVKKESRSEKNSERKRGRSIRTKASGYKDFHLGLNAYYSLAKNPEVKYTSTTTLGTSVTTTSVEGAYQTGGAPGLGLRLMYLPLAETPADSDEFQLGGSLAYNYDLSRKVTSFILSSGATTTYSDLSLQYSNLEFNLIGGYGGWIFFLGPNYSAVSVGGAQKDPDTSFGGALGVQMGVGYLLPNIGFELGYRTLNTKLNSGVVEIDIANEKGKLWGLLLRGVVYFSL